ncbi:MAG: DUF2721 domain-containing protein [Nanoarchaeota archaeon]|mgnify:FL=1
MNLAELTLILQVSIVPIALISGIGLIILSMTNRLGRIMDRIRLLINEKKNKAQINLLYRRAKIMQRAIIVGSISILFVAILIIMNFMFLILNINSTIMTIIVFSLILILLIISLVLFIYDLTLSLKAVEIEIEIKDD